MKASIVFRITVKLLQFWFSISGLAIKRNEAEFRGRAALPHILYWHSKSSRQKWTSFTLCTFYHPSNYTVSSPAPTQSFWFSLKIHTANLPFLAHLIFESIAALSFLLQPRMQLEDPRQAMRPSWYTKVTLGPSLPPTCYASCSYLSGETKLSKMRAPWSRDLWPPIIFSRWEGLPWGSGS
jgi:hypothetical protein